MPSKSLPSRPSLEHLKHQAKDLLKALKTADSEALARVREFHPKYSGAGKSEVPLAKLSLSDAQLVIAREYGFESWPKLKHHVEVTAKSSSDLSTIGATEAAPTSPQGSAEKIVNLAKDLVTAYESGDPAAIQRLNEYHGRSFTWDDVRAEVWHNVYKVRQANARPGSFALEDAQWLLARQAGLGNWTAFLDSVTTGAPSSTEAYAIDLKHNRLSPRRNLTAKDWDSIIEVMKERRIAELNAGEQMTDAVLKGVAELDHVTALSIGGSQQLTDEGLRHLARMPQLEQLDLSNYPGNRITDRGLEVLRHLPALKTFHICWQPGISDAGIANLAHCEQLETVNLMGTHTGDGAVRALRGKRLLSHFNTGRLVTDAGLQLLQDFPVFKTWQGKEIKYEGLSVDSKPNHLLLDGPFTDEGLANLSGLNGLFGLSFFWHASALTPVGLKGLRNFANLGFLGCEGKLCNDTAMQHIAGVPRLRMLMCQGTVASDDGFIALSQSKSIQKIWGRECLNLTGRGLAALANMPALRGLGVSCKNVDNESLATLPRFPELRELTPIDVTDAGFRHIGQCRKLENLTCMYCRETTDDATEHVAGLPRLKSYYAGLTKITDRSLEILSRTNSLERVNFYECNGITDAGLAFLARLPRLREVEVSGSPNVTLKGMSVFPARVRTSHSV